MAGAGRDRQDAAARASARDRARRPRARRADGARRAARARLRLRRRAPAARAGGRGRAATNARELLAGAAVLAEPVFAATAAPAEGADASHSVLHGLYWLVANLAERSPLLLAVDDVHWADGPSLRFLLYLARRLEGMPVALVLALRTGEAERRAASCCGALRMEAASAGARARARSARRATHALAAARLGRAVPEDARARLPRGDARQPVPADRAAAPAARCARGRRSGRRRGHGVRARRCGDPAARRRASARRRRRSSGRRPCSASPPTSISPRRSRASIAAAPRRSRTRSRRRRSRAAGASQPLRFVHPLVRSAIYEDMPRAERARLHGRAAQPLATAATATAAATHLLLSDPAGDAATVELLRAAARTAMARGAPETAAEFLRRASARRRPARRRAAAAARARRRRRARRPARRRGAAARGLRADDRAARRALARGRARVRARRLERRVRSAAIDVLEQRSRAPRRRRAGMLLDARMVMLAVLCRRRSRLRDLLAARSAPRRSTRQSGASCSGRSRPTCCSPARRPRTSRASPSGRSRAAS